MFSDKITGSDSFIEMGKGSQLLYFHLNMHADDDGFIGNPKLVTRIAGVEDKDLEALLTKKFLIRFESGVCVVKHWRINNQIRKDRYTETKYLKERASLYIRENGAYTTNKEGATPIPKGHFSLANEEMATKWQPLGVAGKVRLGKVSKDKSNKGAEKKPTKQSKPSIELPDWLNKKKWQEWLEYRKSRRLTTSDITLKRQIALLGRFQSQHEAMIEKSITMGWQGLFEPNGGYGNKKPDNILKQSGENKSLETLQNRVRKA